MLDSALQSAFQTFDGEDIYPTKIEKAARIGFNLISNHAFVDGNKRIGVLVMQSFLRINGILISYSDEEVIKLGLSIASGKMSYEDLILWLNEHNITKGQ